jgi:hypothetical protein
MSRMAIVAHVVVARGDLESALPGEWLVLWILVAMAAVLGAAVLAGGAVEHRRLQARRVEQWEESREIQGSQQSREPQQQRQQQQPRQPRELRESWTPWDSEQPKAKPKRLKEPKQPEPKQDTPGR